MLVKDTLLMIFIPQKFPKQGRYGEISVNVSTASSFKPRLFLFLYINIYIYIYIYNDNNNIDYLL